MPTVLESLFEENAKLRKRVVEMDRHNVYLANTVGPMSKENADLKKQLADLKEEKDHQKNLISQYRRKVNLLMSVITSHQVEEVIKQLDSDDFNGAEYFAGR